MNPTRLSRIAIHKKQERMNLKQGIPSLGELEEDIPVLRRTEDGIVSFVKSKNVLYKNPYEVYERGLDKKLVDDHVSSENGHTLLPSGILLQWGSNTTNSDSAYDVSFEVPFPTKCFSVTVNRQHAEATSPMYAINITENKFTIDRDDAISGDQTINYIAVGK